ncbi:MAG: hypothetical protein K1X72_19325 [Pyrinomonadaceae bacterium]|nr:hypothetical protein [Pyrinomonadaceae bacterium]
MNIIKFLLITFLLVFCNSVVKSQNVSQLQVSEAKEKPVLSINYPQVVEFKMVSNKDTYRIGDIMKITFAMLNKSANYIFLRDFDPEVHLIDSKGRKSDLEKYLLVDPKITSEMFELTEPNHMIFKSEYIHIGCNDKKFNNLFKLGEDEKLIFEKNLFAQFDVPCLRIKQTGFYTIKANQTNQFVIGSGEAESNPKTATGKVESNSLRIKIVK